MSVITARHGTDSRHPLFCYLLLRRPMAQVEVEGRSNTRGSLPRIVRQ